MVSIKLFDKEAQPYIANSIGINSRSRPVLSEEPQRIDRILDNLSKINNQQENSQNPTQEQEHNPDPARFQIHIEGYDNTGLEDPEDIDADTNFYKRVGDAINLIANHCQELLLTGNLKSLSEVEDIFKLQYTQDTVRERTYDSGTLMGKHHAYIDAYNQAIHNGSGQQVIKIQSDKEIEQTHIAMSEEEDEQITWTLLNKASKHYEFMKLITERIYLKTLSKLMDFYRGHAEYNKYNLEKYVQSVALLEWANAHKWRFPQGSAGVAQMVTRTLLDLAGIKNGKYKNGIDPNMEAFITNIAHYLERFPHFFQEQLEAIGLKKPS